MWADWTAFLSAATPEVLKEYIEDFEWSTGQPEGEHLPFDIRSRILTFGMASDDTEAGAVADRLFVHVARVLSKAGLKLLTVEDRDRLLAAPTLPATDRDSLNQLRSLVSEHSDHFERLEADFLVLRSHVDRLLSGGSDEFDINEPAADVSVPLPAARLSERAETTKKLCRVLSTSSWLSIHGGPDVGKSQLALLVAAELGSCRGWVRFHSSQSTDEAARHLEIAISALTGQSSAQRHAKWTLEVLTSAGRDGFIVLDDLPQIPGDDPFAERLLHFCRSAETAGARILSTSHFEFPVRLRNALGDRLAECPAPPFTQLEAGDLFRAFGAPDTFFSAERLQFLNSRAAGHPLLLVATAEFLSKRAWQYREEDVRALLRGDHAQTILPEVVGRLTRTLEDPPRELLYRLTLPLGSFDQADIAVLAAVTPSVDRPRERLNELLGAWVQRDSETRFVVSPLVKPLGQSELGVTVRAHCYRNLAEAIPTRGAMTPFECEQAILYNIAAGESGRATTLYVLFLVKALKNDRADHLVSLISMWRDTPLPADLTVGNQLLVRAHQLDAFNRHTLDTGFVLQDIDRLLSQATELDGWGIVAIAVHSVVWLRSQDPARALRYIRRAIELPRIHGPRGHEIVFDHFSLPDLLWVVVADLNTPALLRQWLDAVASLEIRQREQFWGSDVGRQGVWIVPNKVYLVEWEKPKSDQDWDGLLRELDDVLTHAQGLGNPRLEAAITGVMLEILGDRKRLDETTAVANRVLTRWPTNPDVQFKVRGAWGRVYAYDKRFDDALTLLDAALSHQNCGNDHERLRCLLAASVCVEAQNLRYAEQARDLARSSAEAPAIEASRALGEYAISVFQTTGEQVGAVAAFGPWSEAFRRFLEVPHRDKVWRDLFPLFAHVTSFLTLFACDGRPPDQSIDGSPSVAPTRGFLLKDYMPEREGLYRESGIAATAWLMGSYAAAANDGDEASFWMQMAVGESRRIGATFLQVSSGPMAIVQLLNSGQYEDAVEMGVFVGRGLVTYKELRPTAMGDIDGIGVDVLAEFRTLAEQQRQLGDCFALISGVLPTAMALVRRSLSDPDAAASAALQMAAACRELSEDEWGDQELWRTAADLFELTDMSNANTRQLAERVKNIDDREAELKVLGHLLASWHAGPGEALSHQLSAAVLLLQWFPARGAVQRHVLLPYIEAYWSHAVEVRRFAFLAPDITTVGIRAAMEVPEARRIHAILSAAAGGFRIRGTHDALERIRAASP